MGADVRKPGLAAGAALWLIGIYQRWISPRKGFRCAHSVLHGGPGCSGFAKQAIREHGLWRAISRTRQRFRDCRAAMQVLATQQADPPGGPITEEELETAKRQRKKRANQSWCSKNDCGIAACETPGACCSSGASAKTSAGAGLCAGAGEAGGAGMCGAIGEGIGGACGGIAGGISCCG